MDDIGCQRLPRFQFRLHSRMETTRNFSLSCPHGPSSYGSQLAAGSLNLVNVTFMVSSEGSAAEGSMIGFKVLQHLGVDTKELLEEHCDLLDGADCSSVKAAVSPSHCGEVIRLMIVRINRLTNEAIKPRKNWTKINHASTSTKSREK